jgi:hypothetical protein
MSLPPDIAAKLRAILTLDGDKIVWLPRTADFYANSFSRAYDPQGAADNWNSTRAGKAPAWRYDAARGDFMAQAHLRKVALKDLCELLGADYPAQRVAVDLAIKADSRERGKRTIVQSVEVKNGKVYWTRRTRKTHPRTDQLLLDEFNRKYAGKEVLPRKDGMYRIAFHYVTLPDLKAWLKAKEAK